MEFIGIIPVENISLEEPYGVMHQDFPFESHIIRYLISILINPFPKNYIKGNLNSPDYHPF